MCQNGAFTELFAARMRQIGAMAEQFAAMAEQFAAMVELFAAMVEQFAAMVEQFAAMVEQFAAMTEQFAVKWLPASLHQQLLAHGSGVVTRISGLGGGDGRGSFADQLDDVTCHRGDCGVGACVGDRGDQY